VKWRKIGRICNLNNIHPLLYSHMANPVAINIQASVFRIYYSARDIKNRSSIGSIDYDIESLTTINYSPTPLFTYGSDNSFYSHGVSIGCFYNHNNSLYIPFMGWQIRNDNHWRGDIGRLKVSIENNSLELTPHKPIISTDATDPISLSYPWIVYDEGVFKMWYGSTISWDAGNGEMLHVINYASSKDGNSWEKHGLAIPYELGVAQAFSRPTIFKTNNLYHMYFSYRSGNRTTYRIGYAVSTDGLNWTLKLDETGIDVSKIGWDSEMICYPYIFNHKGKCYMLYNGNGYGETGFGLAVLEE
jgi:hypothetical protein